MIKCPNCNDKNDSVTIKEMKTWKQPTVDFTCKECGYEMDLTPSEYAPYMTELDKNGC